MVRMINFARTVPNKPLTTQTHTTNSANVEYHDIISVNITLDISGSIIEKSMGLPEISWVNWQLCDMLQKRMTNAYQDAGNDSIRHSACSAKWNIN